MEQAVNEPIKTRVQTVNGDYLKFKYIIFENNNYYGLKKSGKEIKKIKLDKKYIETIQLKDKVGSIILTILIPVGVIVIAALLLQDSFKWKSDNLFEDSDFTF